MVAWTLAPPHDRCCNCDTRPDNGNGAGKSIEDLALGDHARLSLGGNLGASGE